MDYASPQTTASVMVVTAPLASSVISDIVASIASPPASKLVKSFISKSNSFEPLMSLSSLIAP